MKIITYNVNGIRTVIKKDFTGWLKAADPDVICLQEIKADASNFNKAIFEDLGYHVHINPAEKKGYSGVAIFSKEKPIAIQQGIGIDQFDVEGRLIRIDFESHSIVSTYMPSGASKPERQLYKLQWLDHFWDYIQQLKAEKPKLIVAGDFNICHQAIDIHDPYGLDGFPGFTATERNWMSALLKSGFVDAFRHFNAEPHHYSWWSYMNDAKTNNLGWRIDYILTSDELIPHLVKSRHLTDARYSDHCPVSLEIDL